MAKNKNSIERVIKLVTSLKVINICWNTVKSTVLIHLFKSSTTNAPVTLCEISLIDFFVCQTQFVHPKIYTVYKTEFYNFQIKFEANNYL